MSYYPPNGGQQPPPNGPPPPGYPGYGMPPYGYPGYGAPPPQFQYPPHAGGAAAPYPHHMMGAPPPPPPGQPPAPNAHLGMMGRAAPSPYSGMASNASSSPYRPPPPPGPVYAARPVAPGAAASTTGQKFFQPPPPPGAAAASSAATSSSKFVKPVFVKPGAPPAKSLTMFVGKIPEGTDNTFIMKLLQSCGKITSWKRFANPVTGKYPAFGLAEFDNGEGALRCRRLLNGLSFGGKELLVKPDEKTEKYLEWYVEDRISSEKRRRFEEADALKREEEEKKRKEEEKKENAEKDGGDEKAKEEEVAAPKEEEGETRESADKPAAEEGEEVKEENNEESKAREAEEEEKKKKQRELDNSRPPEEAVNLSLVEADPKAQESISSLVSTFQPKDHIELLREAVESSRAMLRTGDVIRLDEFMEHEGMTDEEKLNLRVVRQQVQTFRHRLDTKERAILEKENKDLIALLETAIREKAKADREKEREKEREQRDRERDRDRDRDRERDRDRRGEDYYRRRDADRPSDDREARDMHSRYRDSRDYSASSSSSSRHDDRYARYRDEDSGKRSRRSRSPSDRDSKRSHHHHSSHSQSHSHSRDDQREGSLKPTEVQTDANNNNNNNNNENAVEQQQQQQQPQEQQQDANNNNAADQQQQQQTGFGFVLGGLQGAKRKAPAPGLFNADDEPSIEAKKKLTLVPIDYSEEERKIAEQALLSQTAAQAEKEEAQRKKVERLKKMIDEIPTSTQGLFAFPVDWQTFDSTNLLSTKVSPWIGKKISEYLGEEVPSLCSFVESQIKSHAAPTAILNELTEVLDQDAEQFVVKLWRFIILEIMQTQVGLR